MTSIVLGSKFACKDWYPADPQLLEAIISEHYTDSSSDVRAIIAPHAGYRYCGEVFSKAMGKINRNQSYDRVFIIGPSHHFNIQNKAIVCDTYAWIGTALDNCPVDYQLASELAEHDVFESDAEVLYPEHSIQLHVPFVQYTLPEVPVVPIIIGTMDSDVEDKVAEIITNVATDKSLFMISSDFTHYGEKFNYTPYTDEIDLRASIKNFDTQAIDLILRNDHSAFNTFISENRNTICGRQSISLLLNILKGETISIEQCDYSMSGDITKDYTNSVSYSSLTFIND